MLKLKNPCYEFRVSEADQKRAAEADLASRLYTLDGTLKCPGEDCGQLVGARKKKSLVGDSEYYEPYPRPHERPAKRRPLRTKPYHNKRLR